MNNVHHIVYGQKDVATVYLTAQEQIDFFHYTYMH